MAEELPMPSIGLCFTILFVIYLDGFVTSVAFYLKKGFV